MASSSLLGILSFFLNNNKKGTQMNPKKYEKFGAELETIIMAVAENFNQKENIPFEIFFELLTNKSIYLYAECLLHNCTIKNLNVNEIEKLWAQYINKFNQLKINPIFQHH